MRTTRIVALILSLLTLTSLSFMLGACHTSQQNSGTIEDGYGGSGGIGGHGGHGGGH